MSKNTNGGGLNRRPILLGGSSAIALAAGITDARPQALQLAQAQAPRRGAPSGRKPNILIIWGDDAVRLFLHDVAGVDAAFALVIRLPADRPRMALRVVPFR